MKLVAVIGQKVSKSLTVTHCHGGEQNIEGRIFEARIHCTSSKVDETWLVKDKQEGIT